MTRGPEPLDPRPGPAEEALPPAREQLPLPRRRQQAHLEPQLRERGGAGAGTPFSAFSASSEPPVTDGGTPVPEPRAAGDFADLFGPDRADATGPTADPTADPAAPQPSSPAQPQAQGRPDRPADRAAAFRAATRRGRRRGQRPRNARG